MRDRIVTRSTSTRGLLDSAMEEDASATASSLHLPPEIWLEVMRPLALEDDFSSLYHAALVNRTLAHLALPQLYTIHQNLKFSSGDEVRYAKRQATLWRSLILSSSADGIPTRFPYCLWITALPLGNLANLLEDLLNFPSGARNALQRLLSGPGLEFLQIRKGRAADPEKAVLDAAGRIVQRIRKVAEEEGVPAGVVSLEGPCLPTSVLKSWLGAFKRLESLAMYDGSVLDGEVGRVIRENCPEFKEVTCYFCCGAEVDADLGAFIANLGPNQLESLTINSRNDLGRDTFRALATHVNSLKRLDLQDLQPSALNSLDLIGPCPHLWFLTLEAEPTAQHSRWTRFKDTAAWVNSCSSLTDLKLRVADNADFFAAASPTTSLLSLKLRLDDDPEGPQFWTTLAQQTALRILEIRFNRDDDDDEFITLARHALMVEALSDLSNLRHLILDEPMTEADFAVAKCDDLEIVYLHAVRMDDSYLQTIASLPRLKRLVFSSPTTFTYDQLVEFVVLLREQPGADHKGFYLGLDHQMWEHQLSVREVIDLRRILWDAFEGSFDVIVQGDPDELHESDFSD